MSGQIVGLDGKVVEEEIPAEDTAEAVLQKLLDELRAGAYKPIRLMIMLEHEDERGYRYMQRTSRMNYSESVTMATVAQRMLLDELLDGAST